jgi:hypothetical protein
MKKNCVLLFVLTRENFFRRLNFSFFRTNRRGFGRVMGQHGAAHVTVKVRPLLYVIVES